MTASLTGRLRFLQIDATTQAVLRRFRPALDREIDHILDAFYAYVQDFPELSQYFEDPAARERAKAGQKRHWLDSVFSGNFDSRYIQSATGVGKAHERIGLKPEFYAGGYAFIKGRLITLAIDTYSPTGLDHLIGRAGRKRSMIGDILIAIDRAITLDQALVTDVYFMEMQKTTARLVGSLAEEFQESVGSIVTVVSHSAGVMRTTASNMAGEALESVRTATLVASGAEEAAVNVQAVASATDQLSSSIQDIAHQIHHTKNVADVALTNAHKTNDLVQRLSIAAASIDTILNAIETIASRTNMLALNATIEATRAGTAGSGFAVVATEVRSLAGQTREAAKCIARQIGEVQAATSSSTDAMEIVTTIIHQMNDATTTIAAAIEEQSVATSEITYSIKQASLGTDAVTCNIQNITRTARNTGDAAEGVTNSAEHLVNQADALTSTVKNFLVTMQQCVQMHAG
jgi:methyl-accepting chemotaxis protein